MNIDSIKNGMVIDHIACGKAMDIYSMLSLDKLDCAIALLQSVPSKKMGKKDIIKIDRILDINFDALGFISPNITVDIAPILAPYKITVAIDNFSLLYNFNIFLKVIHIPIKNPKLILNIIYLENLFKNNMRWKR